MGKGAWDLKWTLLWLNILVDWIILIIRAILIAIICEEIPHLKQGHFTCIALLVFTTT